MSPNHTASSVFPSADDAPLQNLGSVRVQSPAAAEPPDDSERQALIDEAADRLKASAIAAAEEVEQAYQNARILRNSIDRTYGAVQVEHAWRKLYAAIKAYGATDLPEEVNAAIARAALERPPQESRKLEYHPIKLKLDPFPHDFEAYVEKRGIKLYYRTRGPRSPLRRVVDERAIAKAYLAIMKMAEQPDAPVEAVESPETVPEQLQAA